MLLFLEMKYICGNQDRAQKEKKTKRINCKNIQKINVAGKKINQANESYKASYRLIILGKRWY